MLNIPTTVKEIKKKYSKSEDWVEGRNNEASDRIEKLKKGALSWWYGERQAVAGLSSGGAFMAVEYNWLAIKI